MDYRTNIKGRYNTVVYEFFDKLDKAGILAMAKFTCCQSCGSAEIEDHKENHHFAYVFYHKQDKEGLDKNGVCYLAWDRFDDSVSYREIYDLILKASQEFKSQYSRYKITISTEADVDDEDSLISQRILMKVQRDYASFGL